jgi:hypothetical protein
MLGFVREVERTEGAARTDALQIQLRACPS